jgi:hypothetical protein
MAMLLGVATHAAAQSIDAGIGVHRQGGYNALHLKFGGDYPLTTSGDLRTSAAGEFGVQFFDGYSQTALLGGVRLGSAPDGGATPFAQVLLGGFFCCDTSAFALQFGGGVDVPMDNLTLRIQADIPVGFYEGDTETGFRVSVAMVFRINRQ